MVSAVLRELDRFLASSDEEPSRERIPIPRERWLGLPVPPACLPACLCTLRRWAWAWRLWKACGVPMAMVSVAGGKLENDMQKVWPNQDHSGILWEAAMLLWKRLPEHRKWPMPHNAYLKLFTLSREPLVGASLGAEGL